MGNCAVYLIFVLDILAILIIAFLEPGKPNKDEKFHISLFGKIELFELSICLKARIFHLNLTNFSEFFIRCIFVLIMAIYHLFRNCNQKVKFSIFPIIAFYKHIQKQWMTDCGYYIVGVEK